MALSLRHEELKIAQAQIQKCRTKYSDFSSVFADLDSRPVNRARLILLKFKIT